MLNEKQEEAANFKDGQMLVVSCPGSGKTTVIVERAKRLIDAGVKPENILVITFTKEAAVQMQNRYFNKYGGSGIFFGTIHSICFRVLSKAFAYGKDDILLATEQWEFFQKYLYKRVSTADLGEFIKGLVTEIGYVRNKGIDYRSYKPQNCDKDLFYEVFRAYAEYKRDMGKIDFDDMLVLCRQCFLERPKELAYWKAQFPYIMIDEFQDTNNIQADIFYMLAGKQGNIFVVGDDDQSIYGFRSADSSIMLNFPKQFKCSMVNLDTNYRSEREIINRAAKLIAHNKSRFKKAFLGNKPDAGTVSAVCCNAAEQELNEIVKNIESAHRSGTPYQEMAVLYRTNIENQLLIGRMMKLNIPFYTTENPKDYHQDFIFQDILAYYRLAEGIDKKGDVQRILNRPSRYLKTEVFKNCRYDQRELLDACNCLGDNAARAMAKIYELLHSVEQLRGKGPFEFVSYLVNGMDYRLFIDNYCKFVQRDKEMVNQLLDLLMEESKGFATMEEWIAYAKFYSENLQKQKRNKKKEGICFSTFHSAKGLEWDRVYIMNTNEGYAPHKKAETPEDFEEERRLFYVAVTRARKECRIFYTMVNGPKKLEPSRFLFEMGLLTGNSESKEVQGKIKPIMR